MLTLSLLGAPRAERDGAAIEVDTRKAVALLAFLAVEARPQTRETLVTLLWPDSDPDHARGALRRTLSTLKKALPEDALETGRGQIGLRPSSEVWIDVDEFRRLLAETKTHGHRSDETCAACVGPLASAVDLYRGDFLAGFGLRDSIAFDDWQFFQTEALRNELAGALDRLIDAESAQGDLPRALAHARRRLALDPLHEPTHRRLMELYSWTGQRATALRQYRECVRVLHRELGVSPLEETRALYEAIVENRVSPPAPSAPPATTAPPTALSPLPLVGREREWQALLGAYADASSAGRLVVVEGEAGIGKTRLAEEFVADARKRGAATIAVRCYEEERGLAYGPVVEALRAAVESLPELPGGQLEEAARLLPELPVPPPAAPLHSPGAQGRFFDAVSQVLVAACTGKRAGILFVDDVHWADEASLDLLTYAIRRLHDRSLCALLTWRPEDVPPGHRLRRLLADLQRAGRGTVLQLDRLSKRDVEQLSSALGPAGEPRLGERLFEETNGVPLFLVEYLTALAEGRDATAPPRGVRDLLHARLAATSEIGRQVVAAAAVIGRPFDLDLVREASGRSDEETVAALEELAAKRLVEEGTNAYEFAHDHVRALVYDETSLARRRLLHRRVAGALARGLHGPASGGSVASVVARHYLLAGDERDAAEYFKLAGEHARSLYANAEALSHFQAALALGHPEPAALHEAIGDLFTLLGDYRAAVTSYETAAAQQDLAEIALLEHKLGTVHDRRGEWELADSHFEAALNALADGGPARARILADRSLTAHHRGDDVEALALAQEAVAVAEAAADPRALAQAHNILGVLAKGRGELERACDHLEQSVALAEAVGDAGARIAAFNNLALVQGARGELDLALGLLDTALALCASQGDRHREAALHNNVADLLHAAGRSNEAMSHLKQAVAIFAEVGEPDTMQPEIWKLVEW